VRAVVTSVRLRVLLCMCGLISLNLISLNFLAFLSGLDWRQRSRLLFGVC
jgi:hypothetical protein